MSIVENAADVTRAVLAEAERTPLPAPPITAKTDGPRPALEVLGSGAAGRRP